MPNLISSNVSSASVSTGRTESTAAASPIKAGEGGIKEGIAPHTALNSAPKITHKPVGLISYICSWLKNIVLSLLWSKPADQPLSVGQASAKLADAQQELEDLQEKAKSFEDDPQKIPEMAKQLADKAQQVVNCSVAYLEALNREVREGFVVIERSGLEGAYVAADESDLEDSRVAMAESRLEDARDYLDRMQQLAAGQQIARSTDATAPVLSQDQLDANEAERDRAEALRDVNGHGGDVNTAVERARARAQRAEARYTRADANYVAALEGQPGSGRDHIQALVLKVAAYKRELEQYRQEYQPVVEAPAKEVAQGTINRIMLTDEARSVSNQDQLDAEQAERDKNEALSDVDNPDLFDDIELAAKRARERCERAEARYKRADANLAAALKEQPDGNKEPTKTLMLNAAKYLREFEQYKADYRTEYRTEYQSV